MAEKITDKLNELDAGSVTPQEFQEVWGISKEEYLNRMMNHIHQRKAEAAEEAAHEGKEEHDELKEMKGQVAALRREVEQLRQEVKELKALLNEQPHWPSTPGMEYAKRLIASKSLGKKDRQNPIGDEYGQVFRMMSQGESFVISPLHEPEWYGRFVAPGVFSFSDKEEEAMEGATEGHRPKSRRK